MPITALPTPPTRSDPTNFSTRADAFLAALPAFATEANALQTDVNLKEISTAASAATATTQANTAINAKNEAATSASEALSYATNASDSAASAASAAASAITSFDSFDDRYLGAKTSSPTLDNDGNALLIGALYWDTPSERMLAWSGTAWIPVFVASGSEIFGPASSADNTLPRFDGTTGRLLQSSGVVVGDSNNVGIGRSPNYRVDAYLSGTGSPAIASSNDNMITVMQSVGTTHSNIGTLTSHPLVFITANAERMRLDQSGNLGIDKTPNAKLDYRSTVSVIGTSATAVQSRTHILTASVTLTLPTSPTTGDWISVVNRSGTTTAVIGRNGQNIMGLNEDMTLDNLNASLTLVFADATRGWVWI